MNCKGVNKLAFGLKLLHSLGGTFWKIMPYRQQMLDGNYKMEEYVCILKVETPPQRQVRIY